MNKHRLLGIFSGILFLYGCGPTMILDRESRSAVSLDGALFRLNQDVTIPPGRARTFFQDGRLVGGINEFMPHCELTVRSLQETSQTVHGDIFNITGVTGDVQKVVRSGKIRLAALGEIRIADGGDDGESKEMQVLNMRLQSERQPDVQYLVCGGAFDIPALARQPTLQDIRTALGTIGTLEIRRTGRAKSINAAESASARR